MLAGGGPADVVELTIALAAEMLAAVGVTGVDPAEKLADGSAMDVWWAMIAAQGGDPAAPLPVAAEQHVVVAEEDGFVTAMDAYAVGLAAWRLGAGRERQGHPVSAGGGVEMHVKPGERVRRGDPVFTLHADDAARFDGALAALDGEWAVGADAPARVDLVIDRIG